MLSAKTVDIAIVGAGPGGAAAAIGLQNKGLSVAIIDKSVFPREKICGDAIPYWVLDDLEPYCQGIHQKFIDSLHPAGFDSTSLLLSDGKSLNFEWTKPGYLIERKLFDNFLLKEALSSNDIRFIGGVRIAKVIRHDNGIELLAKDGKTVLKCTVLVGADGAPSLVAKAIARPRCWCKPAGHALRMYYKDVNLGSTDTSLIFYDKSYAPGYFWIFPLPDNRANVGFGMACKDRKRKKLSMRHVFNEMIENNPQISRILKSATAEGSVKGGSLPFAGRWKRLSAGNIMLVGDAANLMDPVSGDGIRNAVRSGLYAAETLVKAFQGGSFNSELIGYYDILIKKNLWPELHKRLRIVKLIRRLPWLVPVIVRLGDKGIVKRWLRSWL